MFQETYQIEFPDVDFMGNVKADVLFSKMSIVATKDAYQEHLYTDEMRGHYGWIVAKQSLIFQKPIRLDDTLTIRTDSHHSHPVIFPRSYQLIVGNEVVARGYSIWTLIDLKNRRIIRPKSLGLIVPEKDKMEEEPTTLFESKDVTFDRCIPVVYSDLDTNGHMNNTRYIAHAFDLLDMDYIKEHRCTRIDINYKKEVRYGSHLNLYHVMHDDCFHVEGYEDDEICFIIEMTMKKI